MKIRLLLWHALLILLNLGNAVRAVPYDYSATTECLKEPWKAQYSGGIIQNAEFDFGIQGWDVFGKGIIEEHVTNNGNKFIAAFNRTRPSDGLSQRISIKKGKLYAFSAWIQVNEGSEIVAVVFRSPSGEKLQGGTVIAEQGCWSMLKGGIVANFSGPVHLTFEANNTAVEILVDNVSLQPFTKKQWRLHQAQSISKVRKRKVKFQVTKANNSPINGAKITLKQKKPGFPIGLEINQFILNNTAYQNWFTSRFTVTAFGNQLKWYFTEPIQGQENYTIPDAMVHFCEQNNIDVRGHNIFWDDPKYQPNWVYNLTAQELREAAKKRVKSVVSRYKGRLVAWDVVNENVRFGFFEDKLGQNTSAEFYAETYETDQKPLLFMNEYNTTEFSEDVLSIPSKYARRLKSIVSYYRERNDNKTLPMAVGLESRFITGEPNLAYMRAAMDYLASMGFPLWLTEVFIDKGGNQVKYLDDVLREGYSHPAVKGIVIWPTSPFSNDCIMCLTDLNFKNTRTGDVVDDLIAETRMSKPLQVLADGNGISEAVLLHGDYEVTVRHAETNSSTMLTFQVIENSPNIVHIQPDVS